MNIRNIFIICAVIICLAPFSAFAADSAKIGIIDMQVALNDTDKGRKILETMKSRLIKENDILQKKREELDKMQEDLQKQGLMMEESVRRSKEEKFRKLSKEFERYREDKKTEFMENQRRATETIYQGIMEVLKDYAKKEGYTIIIEGGKQAPGVPGALIYYDEGVDITKAIVKIYNEKNK